MYKKKKRDAIYKKKNIKSLGLSLDFSSCLSGHDLFQF